MCNCTSGNDGLYLFAVFFFLATAGFEPFFFATFCTFGRFRIAARCAAANAALAQLASSSESSKSRAGNSQ